MRKPKRNIIFRMSDVVPSAAAPVFSRPQKKRLAPLPQSVAHFGRAVPSDAVPYFLQSEYIPKEPKIRFVPDRPDRLPTPLYPLKRESYHRVRLSRPLSQPSLPTRRVKHKKTPLFSSFKLRATLRRLRYFQARKQKSFNEFVMKLSGSVFRLKWVYAFASVLVATAVSFSAMSLVQNGMAMKGRVLGVSQDGYASLNDAMTNMKEKQFDRSAIDFDKAAQSFREASIIFDDWNTSLVEISRFVPLLSKLSSGKYAVEAGEHIALAGKNVNDVIDTVFSMKNPLDASADVPILAIAQQVLEGVDHTKGELIIAQNALNKVAIDDIPEDKRAKFLQVRTQLPAMIGVMESVSDSNKILSELLGANGPRKYLFLFQNNHEMRATGGFIGSYGLLDIANGRVRKFFVDGIFNPDGQLKENIVPPIPIQKMSAAWSLHDSNWFPDFPTSAKEAMFFYEKTGGPTVDGVITLTPTVMQKLLRVTGPIYMEAYDKTLNADNFTEEIQQQVEVDYDKEENKPKQILADLAPILLDTLFSKTSPEQMMDVIRAFEEGLGEKHILLYSRNEDVERMIDAAGWSGRMLASSKDFISIINTNINGYKTDGVIDESIQHTATIQNDGSIIDTVTITRKHNGGYTDKEWWNKVNADYMRVYVPQGSKLLSAEGQTRETVDPPLNYDKLGFRRDELVQKEESETVIDSSTGTRIYDDAGKTVFANWVYVSPQESVTITYSYLLPFTVSPDKIDREGFDSYALVAQKQSGSTGSHFVSNIEFPSQWKTAWQSPETMVPYDDGLRFEGDLTRDRFVGAVFSR